MLDDFRADACPFAGVVVWSYSRFARDIDDSQFYRADLRRRGYELHSITDPIPAGLDGRFFESAIDWMNQKYLDNLSQDVRRGLLYIVQRYHALPGGPVPVGYVREAMNIGKRRDGRDHILYKLVQDAQTAPIVRQAFEMRAGGATLKEIHHATGLMAHLTNYNRMMASRIYRGEYQYGGVLVPDFCEPIVDEQTWQRAQAKQNLHPRRVRSPFLLSGVGRCAVCGGPLIGTTTIGRAGKVYRYYRCQNRYGGTLKCTAPHRMRKEALEAKIITALRHIILDPTIQQELYAEYMRQADGWKIPMQARITGLDSQISTLERRVSNLVQAIADGGHSQAMLMQLGDLERDLQDAQASRREAARELDRRQPPAYTGAQIGEIVEAARDALGGADDVAVQKIIRAFIARVDAALIDGELQADVYYYGLPGVETEGELSLR